MKRCLAALVAVLPLAAGAQYSLQLEQLNSLGQDGKPLNTFPGPGAFFQLQACTDGVAVRKAVCTPQGYPVVQPTAIVSLNPPSYPEGSASPLSQDRGGRLRVTVQQEVFVSTSNSSTANLDPGGIFTGAPQDTLGIDAIQINLRTDQPTVYECQQSMDGVNWDIVDRVTVAANFTDSRTFLATGAWTRVVVTNNGSAPTTYFRLQMVLAPVVNAHPRALTQAGNFPVGIAEPMPNNVATGTITSTQDVSISASGLGNVRYAVSGTWTGTLYFESTIDGTTWIPTVGVPVPATILGGAVVASTAVNGNWESRAVALQRFRVRGVVTSGTANVTIVGNMSTDFIIAGVIDDGVVFATATTPLGAGGVWQSPVIDMLPYASETTAIYADAPSATNGVVVEVSHDGVTWFPDHSTTYTNQVAEAFIHNRKWRYSRVTYTNGATPQTRFVLQIILQRVSPQTRTAHFSEALHDDDTALLSRSVLTGQRTTVGGGYGNATVTSDGALNVNPSHTSDALTSAYAKPITTQHDVQVALLWPHGVNTRILDPVLVGTATLTYGTNNQNATLATAAYVGSSASVATRSTARFTPQQSVRMVFSTRAFNCVLGNRKVIGVGYPLTASNGVGYFFGCDPTTGLFGVAYRSGGVDHFTPRSAWNVAKLDGTVGQPVAEVFDPTLANFYAIDYRMGTGTTQFFINLPGKEPTLVHEFKWRNQPGGGSGVSEGFLPIRAENTNVTSSTATTQIIGPMALLAETNSSPIGVNYSFSNRQTAISTTAKPVFSIRNNATWNGTGGPIVNRIGLALQSVSFTTTGGGTATIGACEIRLNSTLGAAPVWNDLNANNSIVATDTASTTVTGGDAIFTYTLANNLVNVLDLTPYRLRLNPGETFSLVCYVDAGAAVDVRGAFSWVEEW